MSYTSSLNSQQKQNAAILTDTAKKAGITNPFALAALLAVVSKESELIPKNENLNYSATRIAQVWPRLSSKASELAGKPVLLGNAAYGGMYGNGPNEGYTYRGRGFNQITFKSNYQRYGSKIGEDLVKNPDLLLRPEVASKAAVEFFKEKIQALKNNGKLAQYNSTGINDFKNETDALLAFYHANAGEGRSVSEIKNLMNNDPVGGFKKALKRISDLVQFVGSAAVEQLKKKPLATILITAVLTVSIYVLITALKNKS